MLKKSQGFTIVELLIVIVVIGILAAISIVSYNSIAAKTRDTQMRDGAAKFIKALYMWSAEGGDLLAGNWGSTVPIADRSCPDGSGGGFVAAGTYLCTTEDVLVANGLLPLGFVSKLPKNQYISYTTPSNGNLSMMIYSCSGGSWAVYWTLERPSAEDTASFNDVASRCSGASLRASYGMQAAALVKL